MSERSRFAAARRRFLQCSAAALAAPAAARAAAPPADAGLLRIVGPWEIAGLAPASSGYIFTRLEVAETLLGASDDGLPAPGLAQRWSTSADGLVWRFALRPQARFHDGTPVTADAVVACLRRALVPPSLLSAAPVQAIEAVAGGVEIRLQSPYGGLAGLLAHYSTMVIAPSSYGANGTVTAVVGSGPYRVTTLAAPQRLEVAAFDGYDGPPPRIARARYLSAGRSETRALLAESGQADLAYGMDAASRRRLQRNGTGGLRIVSATLPRTAIVKLNAAHPALADVQVRRALAVAVDRPGIAHALLRDQELAATQLFAPALAGWHSATVAPLAFEPLRAQLLLDEAGWPRRDDGLRANAAGRVLRLSLRTFVDRPELPLIATALQEQWRQVGVAVDVLIGNSADVPLAHRNGTLEMALVPRNYATVPDPAGTLLQDFGPRGGEWGAMGWRSGTVVDALTKLTSMPVEPAEAAGLRSSVVGVLQDELPVIPVVWYRQQVAAAARLQGVTVDPLERSYRIGRMAWRA